MNRIGKLSPHDNYIVLKDTEVLNDLVATEKLIIINKSFGNKSFQCSEELLWKTLFCQNYYTNLISIYIFLFFSLFARYVNKIPSVVGVTNLAPFSTEAIKSERFLIRLKLKLLKKTILSATIRSNSIVAISKKMP